MKQRFFSKLFTVLLAVFYLSIFSTNQVYAAEPVTIRYEVICEGAGLDFVSYWNENGPVTQLLAAGTTLWTYQFTTTNTQQWVSVYPAPAGNLGTPASIVSRVYINGVLYKVAGGQEAVTASIHVPLANLIAAESKQQWSIRYEVAAQQTTLGFVTYSNSHTANQVEPLAQGMTKWAYEYTTTTVDQLIKVDAVPMLSYDPNPFYAVEIKVFVNDVLYATTWRTHTQPAVVDETLSNLLAKGPALTKNTGLQIIPGYALPDQPALSTTYSTPIPNQPIMINLRQMIFGDPYQPHVAGLSFYTNDRVIFLALGTGPQSPVIENTGTNLIAAVQPR